jgi:hypothetical protein
VLPKGARFHFAIAMAFPGHSVFSGEEVDLEELKPLACSKLGSQCYVSCDSHSPCQSEEQTSSTEWKVGSVKSWYYYYYYSLYFVQNFSSKMFSCLSHDAKSLTRNANFQLRFSLERWIIVCLAILLLGNHFSGSHPHKRHKHHKHRTEAAHEYGGTNPLHGPVELSKHSVAAEPWKVNWKAEESAPPPMYVLGTKPNSALHDWQAWAGEWVVAYSNGFQTMYTIGSDGSIVLSIDDGADSTGQLKVDPNSTDASLPKYVVQHRAPKYEKVQLLGEGRMLLEQWIGDAFCCRGAAIRKNGPMAEHSGLCQDDINFIDETGVKCTAWSGYDCSTANSIWGYSVHGKDNLLKKCAATCTVCDVMLAENLLQQVQSHETQTKSGAPSDGSITLQVSR